MEARFLALTSFCQRDSRRRRESTQTKRTAPPVFGGMRARHSRHFFKTAARAPGAAAIFSRHLPLAFVTPFFRTLRWIYWYTHSRFLSREPIHFRFSMSTFRKHNSMIGSHGRRTSEIDSSVTGMYYRIVTRV